MRSLVIPLVLCLISLCASKSYGEVIHTFSFATTQTPTTAFSIVQNLTDGPVSFTATLSLSAFTAEGGGNVSSGTVGAANADMTFQSGSTGGVGVVSAAGTSLINANEAIQVSLAVSNVVGGNINFTGFRVISFSNFGADDSAVLYSAPGGTRFLTFDAGSGTSVDLAPYGGSSFILFGNTDADRNNSSSVSPTSFRMLSLQASFAVPEPTTILALPIVAVLGGLRHWRRANSARCNNLQRDS